MKTLTIEPPKGQVIDFDQKTCTIKFKEEPKDPLDRINTDEDVLVDNGYTWETFNKWCEGLRVYERADRFLELLHKSFNGDWIPDFDNGNEWKYQPRFVGGSSGFRCDGYVVWLSNSVVGSRLCFKEERHAIHAGKKFTKWFKESIIK